MRMRIGRGCELVMRPSPLLGRWGYRRWVRAYLVRCGGISPAQRRRAPGRLSLAEREESREVWRPGSRCGRSRRGWVVPPRPSVARSPHRAVAERTVRHRLTNWRGHGPDVPALQARDPAATAWNRGREAATAAVVTAADRRLAEDHLPRRPGDAGVARDDLPHPVHSVPRRVTQGADRASAYRAGPPSAANRLPPSSGLFSSTGCVSVPLSAETAPSRVRPRLRTAIWAYEGVCQRQWGDFGHRTSARL